jgi:FAD dependent monooxygenase
MIEKLQRKYVYPDNPRFSVDDAAGFCARLSNVPIWRDICVAHLWRNRISVSMTALEEGLFQTWHFGRVVLLGDSVHKVSFASAIFYIWTQATRLPDYMLR